MKKPPIPVRKQGMGGFRRGRSAPAFRTSHRSALASPRTGRFTYACFGFVMREWMMLVSSATPPKTVSAM